jgi:biopolymer transport protein ExbD
MKRFSLSLICFIEVAFLFSNCDDSTKDRSQYSRGKLYYEKSSEAQYITPPRLSDPGMSLRVEKEPWYSFILKFFKGKRKPLPFIKILAPNTDRPDIELCQSETSFILPDTTFICVDITHDGRIIFDFDFPYEENNPIFVEAPIEDFQKLLYEYQLKFLEHNINPPIIFRIDGRTAFDLIFRLSKILRNMEMEYLTVITYKAKNEIQSGKNDMYAFEIPLPSEGLIPRKGRGIVISSISDSIQHSFSGPAYASAADSKMIRIYLDESGEAYYSVGRMRGPKMIDDDGLASTLDHYYRYVELLDALIIASPEASFCKLLEILDKIKKVEQDIRNSLIHDPSADLSKMDFFQRLRIQETTEWDDYQLSKIRENPKFLEELEDAN